VSWPCIRARSPETRSRCLPLLCKQVVPPAEGIFGRIGGTAPGSRVGKSLRPWAPRGFRGVSRANRALEADRQGHTGPAGQRQGGGRPGHNPSAEIQPSRAKRAACRPGRAAASGREQQHHPTGGHAGPVTNITRQHDPETSDVPRSGWRNTRNQGIRITPGRPQQVDRSYRSESGLKHPWPAKIKDCREFGRNVERR